MISNNKSYIETNKVRKKTPAARNKPRKPTYTYSYDDMDNSLRFHEEKKRQKQNWKKYAEEIEIDES